MYNKLLNINEIYSLYNNSPLEYDNSYAPKGGDGTVIDIMGTNERFGAGGGGASYINYDDNGAIGGLSTDISSYSLGGLGSITNDTKDGIGSYVNNNGIVTTSLINGGIGSGGGGSYSSHSGDGGDGLVVVRWKANKNVNNPIINNYLGDYSQNIQSNLIAQSTTNNKILYNKNKTFL